MYLGWKSFTISPHHNLLYRRWPCQQWHCHQVNWCINWSAFQCFQPPKTIVELQLPRRGYQWPIWFIRLEIIVYHQTQSSPPPPPLTGPFKQIMRSFSKREKISYALSPRPYICLVLAVLISVHLCINTHSLLNHHWHHLRMRRLWPRANDVATWLCKKRLIKQVNHAVLVLFAMSGLLWYAWHEKVRERICELCLSAL